MPSVSVRSRLHRREIFRHESIFGQQRRHFYWLDVVPVAVVIFLLGPWWYARGVAGVEIAVFAIFYALNVVGLELGYHRYFSHRAFECHPAMKAWLLVTGAMTGQGPAIAWSSTHRHHHKYSDVAGDIHSPHALPESYGARPSLGRRFFHAQVFWKYEYPFPNPAFYCPQWLKDPLFQKLDRLYYLWVALGLVLPGLLGALLTLTWEGAVGGFLVGGVLRLAVGQQMTWFINTLCHLVGSRPFRAGDQSRNIGFMAPLTLGGSWHNNHHAFPSSATNQIYWWQWDPGYQLLKILRAFQLVSNLKTPHAELVTKKTRRRRVRENSVFLPSPANPADFAPVFAISSALGEASRPAARPVFSVRTKLRSRAVRVERMRKKINARKRRVSRAQSTSSDPRVTG